MSEQDDLKLNDPPAPPPSSSAPTPVASPAVPPPPPPSGNATVKNMEDDARRDAEAIKKIATGGLMDFLNFRIFVFPIFVKYLFLLFSAVFVIMGFIMMFANVPGGVLRGLCMVVIGPVFVRLSCETSIVLFKIYEELKKKK